MLKLGRAASVAVFTGVVLMPTLASAEWFANPFFGKLSKIVYTEPTVEGPTVFGISGGTSPRGIVGAEVDFTKSREFFGPEAEFGTNNVRTITGSAIGGYPIKIGGVTRLRPYGAFGGGLGITRLGFQRVPDFDFLSGLPPQRQLQISDCLARVGEPTSAQFAACGVPLVQEDQGTGYFGTLSVGAGVMAFIAPHVGARVDFRHFKRVPSDEPLDFWRFTVGVIIH